MTAEGWTLRPIAHMRNGFADKFGLPRQSGLAEEIPGEIVFLPEFRVREAFRGLEQCSHLWLVWVFDRAARSGWSPTVRPPRLGGNTRVGVFATRSPFRPNPVGLSCVRLERVDFDAPEGPVLHVRGADLADGTPILDVKPYLPYADSRPDARAGLYDPLGDQRLRVVLPEALTAGLPEETLRAAREILSRDPRPGYQHDPARRYGLGYGGYDFRFTVDGDTLTVAEICPSSPANTNTEEAT